MIYTTILLISRIYIVISHADTIMFLWIFKNKDKYLTLQVLHAQKTKLAVKKNIK